MALLFGLMMMVFALKIFESNGAEDGEDANVANNGKNGRDPKHPKWRVENYVVPKLPDTYKDIFIPGTGGKPTLGTPGATCWARGGICVQVRICPSLNIDVGVPGCSWGNKVCCIVHRLLSPTVGIQRRAHLPTIYQPEDLGTALRIVAKRNSAVLTKQDDMQYDSGEEQDHETD